MSPRPTNQSELKSVSPGKMRLKATSFRTKPEKGRFGGALGPMRRPRRPKSGSKRRAEDCGEGGSVSGMRRFQEAPDPNEDTFNHFSGFGKVKILKSEYPEKKHSNSHLEKSFNLLSPLTNSNRKSGSSSRNNSRIFEREFQCPIYRDGS